MTRRKPEAPACPVAPVSPVATVWLPRVMVLVTSRAATARRLSPEAENTIILLKEKEKGCGVGLELAEVPPHEKSLKET